ncbi:MAG: hypothetical protein HYY81_05095 [Deltaproteobacteria bacterium]|nr:hypothetical protein [Deltaproteobacteria bacterium]
MAAREQFGAAFIYDAVQKKAILWGKTESGAEVQLELVHRNDDDSHDALLMVGKKEKTKFVLREDEVEYRDGGFQLKQPSVRIVVDNVSAAKFRGFTKGNVPTPDIPSETLP